MYAPPILELLQDCEDPPLTPESLEELEIELGVRFSQDYANFLLQFNGGDFKRWVSCRLPTPTVWISDNAVRGFYGNPADRAVGEAITEYSRIYSGRIPDDCLAIAFCNCEDLVLLQVAGAASELGNIWFWDGTEEGEGAHVHSLADSFSAFLSMLEPDPREDYEQEENIPIFVSIEFGLRAAVERFLSQGVNVETRNAEGMTLLAAAAWYSWPKIVRLLLDHGADPNAHDLKGRTTLHYAAGASHDSVKLLLAAGADAKARDHGGKSVLAEWSYQTDQLLRARRAHGINDRLNAPDYRARLA